MFYKTILSPFIHRVLGIEHACRYLPTCSEFATIHIAKEGILKGGLKSVARIIYCQPLAKNLPKALRY